MLFNLFSKQTNKNKKKIKLENPEAKRKIELYQQEIDTIIKDISENMLLPDKEMSEAEVIKLVSKNIDSRHCAACGADFGRDVKRATTCPKCGERVIVRSGLIITDKIEQYCHEQWRLSNHFYSHLQELADSIIVKDYLYDKNYIEALIYIAEAYQKLERGDQGWKILNSEVIDIAQSSRDWGKIYVARVKFLRNEDRDKEGLIEMCFMLILSLVDIDSDMVLEEYDYYVYELLSLSNDMREELNICKADFIKMFDDFIVKKPSKPLTKKIVRNYIDQNI